MFRNAVVIVGFSTVTIPPTSFVNTVFIITTKIVIIHNFGSDNTCNYIVIVITDYTTSF